MGKAVFHAVVHKFEQSLRDYIKPSGSKLKRSSSLRLSHLLKVPVGRLLSSNVYKINRPLINYTLKHVHEYVWLANKL